MRRMLVIGLDMGLDNSFEKMRRLVDADLEIWRNRRKFAVI